MKTINHTPLRTSHAERLLGAKFMGVPWRPHGDAVLRAHHGDLTPKEMACLLDKPLDAVETRMQVLRLHCTCPHPFRRWSERELQKLEAMRCGGASAAEIALAFGRGIGSVWSRLRRSGISRRQRLGYAETGAEDDYDGLE